MFIAVYGWVRLLPNRKRLTTAEERLRFGRSLTLPSAWSGI